MIKTPDGVGRGRKVVVCYLRSVVMMNQNCTYHADPVAEFFTETFTRGLWQMTVGDTEGEDISTLEDMITSANYSDYNHLLPRDVIITSVDYTDYKQELSPRCVTSPSQLLV